MRCLACPPCKRKVFEPSPSPPAPDSGLRTPRAARRVLVLGSCWFWFFGRTFGLRTRSRSSLGSGNQQQQSNGPPGSLTTSGKGQIATAHSTQHQTLLHSAPGTVPSTHPAPAGWSLAGALVVLSTLHIYAGVPGPLSASAHASAPLITPPGAWNTRTPTQRNRLQSIAWVVSASSLLCAHCLARATTRPHQLDRCRNAVPSIIGPFPSLHSTPSLFRLPAGMPAVPEELNTARWR